MMRLIPTSPAAGLTLPEAGATRLTECPLREAWLITAFDATALRRRFEGAGLAWPAPGRVSRRGEAQLLFYGPDQALLLNAPCPDTGAAAAVAEVGDGLAWLRLSGPLAEATLSRLVPLDLRPPALGADSAARTLLGKQDVTLMRCPETGGYDLLLGRPGCASAVAAVEAALQLAAAR